ncbi:Tubulin polyglutamylase complex subunit 2 [Entophlyctis luteolus]|nr:Tubulin polyglutamylase complex subunit 2 [Entophlyctis luteolus]
MPTEKQAAPEHQARNHQNHNGSSSTGSPRFRRSAAIDAFLGGALAYLESCPGVARVRVGCGSAILTAAQAAAERILEWQRTASAAVSSAAKSIGRRVGSTEPSVRLPDDLKRFFQTTDGFSLKWSTKLNISATPSRAEKQRHDGADDGELLGVVHVNGIEGVTPIDCQILVSEKTRLREYDLGGKLAPGAAFVLHNSVDYGKVCLVYPFRELPCEEESRGGLRKVRVDDAEIWFQSSQTSKWHFLAHSFSAYFRMAVQHLGIRGWHVLYTDHGAPQHVLDWLGFYAPQQARNTRAMRADALEGWRRLKRGEESWMASAARATTRGSVLDVERAVLLAKKQVS